MSVSLPTTPPRRGDPHDDGEWRFETLTTPCEWIEDYRPGGYHPVSLGDLFNHGQFKVIRKLGEGSYSTVWLARDLRLAYGPSTHHVAANSLPRNLRYVALKILVSDIEPPSYELQILHHLAKVAPNDGTHHVTQLLAEFEHHGPNGIHKCLVFEPMGSSVNSMVEELPQFKHRKPGVKIRYPPQMAKNILKQALQGLVFLHQHGVAQGDFQPGNMLFALKNIDAQDESVLHQDVTEMISPPVERLDGKQDKWAPRYLYIAQPLSSFVDTAQDLKIKLSDMGGAYFLDNPPKKSIVPVGLRAPELILNGEVDKSLDIWSFGCLVFELITGQSLFCVMPADSETDQNDDHLLFLDERLGPLPDELYRQWTTSSLYFTPERKLYNCQLRGVPDGGEPLMLERESMEESFDQAKPDLTEEEADKVKKLIRRILQYDPAKRPSAAEILRDPWFTEDKSQEIV
ncbi:hypothetical protein FSARC_11631 [Fusarium sarcochroum]|uniref:non-specific serine/threonine protein kinase n=1 Tax=Fusarium sarcochroum TaxID=1208366 RepID=A0A8H4TEL2_9HYPO|nr:hypothetical protein FSARC_11631 [Fusarium sarcochroum]